MKRKRNNLLLDQILVVDVEATCWSGQPPAGEQNEIIEIGVCLFEVASGERSAKRSILVRPARSSVSPFCTELTGHTAESLSTGLSFADACLVLRREYQSGERVWASYGEYDRAQFDRQCRDMAVPYPFSRSHLNVKNLVALRHAWDATVGMDRALERLGLPLEGRHHNGADDAWNIAALLRQALGR